LAVWFIGDIANFIGAVWAGLVPTVIALAVYFCFADAVLITQCLYYNLVNARKAARQEALSANGAAADDPRQPLLRRSSDNIGLPGSRRRSSASTKRRDSVLSSPLPVIPETETSSRAWFRNALNIILVCVAGALGWFIAWKVGAWQPTSADPDLSDQPALGAEILGYASAVAYLGLVIHQRAPIIWRLILGVEQSKDSSDPQKLQVSDITCTMSLVLIWTTGNVPVRVRHRILSVSIVVN